MTLAPMLAESTKIENLDKYITDDKYWFEQKLDGLRLVIHVSAGVVEASNRKGKAPDHASLISALGQLRPALEHLAGEWSFDGEWVHDQFWIFDMPYAMGIVGLDTPYEDRREALEAVFGALEADERVFRLIDVARTCEEKQALLEWCQANDSEGIMVKSRAGKYHPGRRTAAMMKAKFTESIDCILGEIRREGKLSSSLYVIQNGALTEIGSVKMTERDLQRAKTGDVAEIRYLYLGAGNRLYQPTFLGFRHDKDPSECTADQLKFVNKEVRERDRNVS